MVEDSSEIASARASSSYRKSTKRTKLKSIQQSISFRNNSLSKISEENTDDNYNSEALKLKNKVNDYHVTFVCEDEKGTINTSDNDKGNMSHEKENNQSTPGNVIFEYNKNEGGRNILWDEKDNLKESFLLSRLVPELIDINKITIV